MLFNVNESLIINQVMEVPDKYMFLDILQELEENTDDKILKYDIQTLFQKINSLSIDKVKQIYFDRINHNISSYPPYSV